MTYQLTQVEGQVLIKDWPSLDVLHTFPAAQLSAIDGGTTIAIRDDWSDRLIIAPLVHTQYVNLTGDPAANHAAALFTIGIVLTPPASGGGLTEAQVRARSFLRC